MYMVQWRNLSFQGTLKSNSKCIARYVFPQNPHDSTSICYNFPDVYKTQILLDFKDIW